MVAITKPIPTVTFTLKVNKQVADAYAAARDAARSAGLVVHVTEDVEKLLIRITRQINDAVAESTRWEESNTHG